MLVLLRHGESKWNAADRFAGWADIGLTEASRDEARVAGRQLLAHGLVPEVVHASRLARAIETGNLVREACGAPDTAGRGESLADVRLRLLPYTRDCLTPQVAQGRTVLVVSHGNTIRMLRRLVEG